MCTPAVCLTQEGVRADARCVAGGHGRTIGVAGEKRVHSIGEARSAREGCGGGNDAAEVVEWTIGETQFRGPPGPATAWRAGGTTPAPRP